MQITLLISLPTDHVTAPGCWWCDSYLNLLMCALDSVEPSYTLLYCLAFVCSLYVVFYVYYALYNHYCVLHGHTQADL